MTPGRILERRVGVPQTISKRIGAAPIVQTTNLTGRVDVGDIGERFVSETILL